MNKLTIILISFIAIFLSAYWLYWQGELSIKRASGKFTTVGFENTNLNCEKKSLEFFIENNQRKENKYQIEFQLNNETVFDKLISIDAMDKKKIRPDSKIVNSICQKETLPLKFKILVKNEKEIETIYKIIRNPN
jgi:hypothetical protein